MAEEPSPVNATPPPPPPFLEITCKISGKKSRFAAGTKAGFAASLIHKKLHFGKIPVLYIEAVRDGEEPISFGPDAVLVDYGSGWKLQTVTELDFSGTKKGEGVCELIPPQIPDVLSASGGIRPRKKVPRQTPNPAISSLYIGKILVAFVIMFVLGTIFTLALENLPRMKGESRGVGFKSHPKKK